MTARKKKPEEYARALLSELNLCRVGNIEELAARLNLQIEEVAAENFEGALIKSAKKAKGIIALKRNFRESGRRRFTIAHEIGHFILPGHGAVECCKPGEIESWRSGINWQEAEANRFASELLLPSNEIYKIVNRRQATIALAKELCAEFQTSLTATVLKCVAITEEPCAVVWSVDEAIKWLQRNENFNLFISTGKLDEKTLAAKFFQNRISQSQIEGEVFADIWLLNDNLAADAKLWEDSISLPFYNGVLTILTII